MRYKPSQRQERKIEAGEIIRRGFTVSMKGISEEERTIDFVISTERVDRMGDIISLKGWQLKEFRKNPVVLFGHNSSIPPIGKALKVWKTDNELRALAQFMDIDISPFADSVFRMYKQKFLKAVSVGFIPKEWEIIEDEDEDEWFPAFKFLKQELLEFSAVPIPANPDAIMDAKSAGIDIQPIKGWAEEVLDNWDVPEGLIFGMATRKEIEDLYTKANGGKSIVVDPITQDKLLTKNLEAVTKDDDGVDETHEEDNAVSESNDETEVKAPSFVQDDEGNVYILEAPSVSQMDIALLEMPGKFVELEETEEGKTISITCENGFATYAVVGEDDSTLELSLLESTIDEDTAKTVVGEPWGLIGKEETSEDSEEETASESEEETASEEEASTESESEEEYSDEEDEDDASENEDEVEDEVDPVDEPDKEDEEDEDDEEKSILPSISTLERHLTSFEETFEKLLDGETEFNIIEIRKMKFLALSMREVAARIEPEGRTTNVFTHIVDKPEQESSEKGMTDEEIDAYLTDIILPKVAEIISKHLRKKMGRLD